MSDGEGKGKEMTQQDLFSQVERSNPYGDQAPSQPVDTSEEAADHMKPLTGRLRRLVLTLIKRNQAHGMTDADLEKETGLPRQTVTPRRRELVVMGLVRDSGRRRKSETSGRSGIVWVASEWARLPEEKAGGSLSPLDSPLREGK